MKRTCLILLLCLALLGSVGCGKMSKSPRCFAYLDTPAHASLSGSINGLSFTAFLQSEGRAGQMGDVASGAQDFTLTYLSPASLAGIKIQYDAQAEQYYISLDDLHAQGEIYAKLGEAGLLLLNESAVQSTHGDVWSGSSAGSEQRKVIVLNTLDGATRIHDAQTGFPLHVVQNADGQSIEINVSEWVCS